MTPALRIDDGNHKGSTPLSPCLTLSSLLYKGYGHIGHGLNLKNLTDKETRLIIEHAACIDEEPRVKTTSTSRQTLEMVFDLISPEEAYLMRLLIYFFFFYTAL